jgi:hypothetical protein
MEARFIREVDYLEWLANVVLAKKANGKWRICMDFTNLNKACPKDSFPLPRMDPVGRFHEIHMDEVDQEKTAFMTDRGLYCYRMMPFGLKNARATYQRLVNKMF